ncbi:hypothetical protein ACQEU5_07645 [Marinactinospora thermotolerans]|uniref:Uncharacterized protein n=1 Tax=Marinactinospora thermotolerans DSM 45154 TaxID=1122192 RepID=A0A1T4R5V3_9ACTN|nr:hypothetical protein [Marinactinospora thermotolerans]SKA11048.1 hypothetical protein SAMN02745673_02534 [Marinactinospora thermotolerans DSM 45154]
MQVSSPNPLDELRVQRDRLAGPLTGRRAPSTDSHERIVEALDQLLTACLLDPPAPHAHDPRHRLLDAVLELCRRIPEPDSRDGEGDDHLLDHLILLVDQILAASRTDRAGTAFTRRVSAQRLRVALGPVVKAGRPHPTVLRLVTLADELSACRDQGVPTGGTAATRTSETRVADIGITGLGRRVTTAGQASGWQTT